MTIPRVEDWRLAVIGAGVMGTWLAHKAATHGFHVVLLDTNAEALQRAEAEMRTYWERLIAKGRGTVAERDYALGQIEFVHNEPGVAPTAIAGFPWVIEAATERLELKHAIFAAISPVLHPDAIICSNTSAYPASWLNNFACSDRRPVVVLHHFSPPMQQPAAEIAAEERELAERVIPLAWSMGNVPIVTRDVVGFAGNPLFCKYGEAAVQFGTDLGFSIPEIDAITRQQFGGGGIFTALDMTGRGTVAGTRLAVDCLRVFGENLNPWFAPSSAFADRQQPWVPGGSRHIDVSLLDQERVSQLTRLLQAVMFATCLNIIQQEVVGVVEFNWLTRRIFGFNQGLFDTMLALGQDEVFALFDEPGLGVDFPRPLPEVWAMVEGLDSESWHALLKDASII